MTHNLRVHAQHLLAALQEHYKITIDWEAKLRIGITLDWDHNNCTITLSMPRYVKTALKPFNHPNPTKPEHCPYKPPAPQYGIKVQLTKRVNDTP